jgi:pyruvate/2-oxoglutarate/acetoin dehydrogenase E1 component
MNQMNITFTEAIRMALFDSLKDDECVRVFGLGVADPKAVFGTTVGLVEEFGSERVFDIPLSENAITGAAVGMAMAGLRPVMIHQRADFTFTSAEQIINQAAKTFFTSGGKFPIPLVIRMIVGRGWGQGPTHAQSPHALYASVPGLKVVMPATPEDGYSMLYNAVRDPNPVIFIEHRWSHQVQSTFSKKVRDLPLTQGQVMRSGTDLTLAALSFGVLEGLKVATILAEFGVSVELINLRSVSPLDDELIIKSVKKTGAFAFIDTAPIKNGIFGELSALLNRELWGSLRCSPLGLGPMYLPVPSSPYLANQVYLTIDIMISKVLEHLDISFDKDILRSLIENKYPKKSPLGDQPDAGLVGPF